MCASSIGVLAATLAMGAPMAAQAQMANSGAVSSADQPTAQFDIRAFQVRGNTVLSPDKVERAVYPFMGPGRSEADVESARAALQKAFEDAGYVAVSVSVPEQAVDSGILMLEVQPQAIGQLLVEGDTGHADRVKAQAVSLVPGTTPNITAFQRDVIAMNQKASRRVTPELKAGVAPGTLDVVLKVEESSAWHASAELNNFSSAATTDLRAAATIRYDDMWGRGDSLSLSVQTAPQRRDDGTVFSGNYLMRLGQGTQLMLYGVHSDSDIAVVGGTSVIGKGNIAGVRLIQSLGTGEGFYHALTVGADWKDFSEDLRLGSDRTSIPIKYLPVTLSWRGDWSSDRRVSSVTLSGIFGTRGIGTPGGFSTDGCVVDVAHFDCKRYQAQPNFIILKSEAETTLNLKGGLQFNARFAGQWSPDPLIANEGFSLGGMGNVRGYYETESLADYGFAYQGELRSPNLGEVFKLSSLDEMRFHGFWDIGLGRIHQPLDGQQSRFKLMSIGGGARIKLLKYLNGAVDVGTPLFSGPESKSGDIFARFRIWGEF
ncbi:MAG TPA: ShlB/FhaC/HecB family hemolysin secretion/activation protein [Sphingobium sp.]|uniref:ShlB/FhaC/HecB family hemolysin secretion/activation protein n=1 Tax=Sphingobium sp. TaxID=1912891 RepID=UPI002ED00F98